MIAFTSDASSAHSRSALGLMVPMDQNTDEFRFGTGSCSIRHCVKVFVKLLYQGYLLGGKSRVRIIFRVFRDIILPAILVGTPAARVFLEHFAVAVMPQRS